jgi:hypothetical protein
VLTEREPEVETCLAVEDERPDVDRSIRFSGAEGVAPGADVGIGVIGHSASSCRGAVILLAKLADNDAQRLRDAATGEWVHLATRDLLLEAAKECP